MLRRWAET